MHHISSEIIEFAHLWSPFLLCILMGYMVGTRPKKARK